jgi:hypothetical protein
MTIQPGANLYTQGFGSRPENVEVPVISNVAPTANNYTNIPVGKRWIDTASNTEYVLTSISTVGGSPTATWTLLGSASGSLNTLSDQSASVVTPSAGNIQLNGTAGQITTTAGSGSLAFSLPSAVTAPGSLASTTTLTAGTSLAVTTNATVGGTLGVTGLSTLAALTQVGTTNINSTGAAVSTIGTGGTGAVHIGNATGNTAVTGSLTASTTLTATLGAITATNGNLVLGTAGNKLSIATGANASVGTSAAMTAGSITIATTAVTSSSIIQLTHNTLGGTIGILSVPTASIVAGTSFIINSSSALDTSTVNWLIIN